MKRKQTSTQSLLIHLHRAQRSQNVAIVVLFVLLVFTNWTEIWHTVHRLNPYVREHVALERVKALEDDRHTLEDAGNILLALQEHYFEYGGYPLSLQELVGAGRLPLLHESVSEFRYLRINDDQFAFCADLSDEIKGVNKQWCESGVHAAAPVVPASTYVRVRSEARSLLVRTEPHAHATVLYRVHGGEKFEYRGRQGDWLEIVLPVLGRTGWVHGGYTELLR